MDEIIAPRVAPSPVTAHDVFRILRRHALLALFTFAAVVGATLHFTSKMPRIFEANTSVLLDSITPSNVPSGGLMDLLSGVNLGTPMDTEIQKIKSRDFLSEVIRRGELKETNPEDLRNRLNVAPGPGSQLLMIAMRGRTPEEAQQGANWAARVYMDRAVTDFDAKTELSKKRLHRAEARALVEKRNAERRLNAFMARMGTSDPAIYFNVQTSKTMDVKNALDDTRRNLDVQQTQLALYDRQLKTLPPTVVGGFSDNKNPVIDSYQQDIVALQAKRRLLLFDYQADSDEVKAVDLEIDAKQRGIAEAKKAAYSVGSRSIGRSPDYAAAQTNYYNTALAIKTAQKIIAVKSIQLAELEAEQKDLAQKRSVYDGLRRAVEGATQAYEKSRSGLIQMDMSQVTSAPNIRVLDWAQLPNQQISPKPVLNMVMAIALGLILSVGTALFAEYFRVGRDPEFGMAPAPELPAISDLPQINGIPILGAVSVASLPLTSRSVSDKSLAATMSDDRLPLQSAPIEDALREVGYSLAHRHPGDAPPVVLLAGIRSDDSTASLAAHLAATLVRDGLRVTLVDADQAHPRLHRVFGAPDAPGMGDVLAGSVDDPRTILHVGAGGGLRFLAAGSTVPARDAISPASTVPQDDAHVDRLRLLFADLAQPEETDIVIVSGPAIWNVRAALPLEKATDGLVLVTPPDVPAGESLARARRLLSNGYKPRILGVVMGDSAATVPPVALTEVTQIDKEEVR
ncbi:MAG: GNVR domain-containing protein [Armatimonadota bacterium]